MIVVIIYVFLLGLDGFVSVVGYCYVNIQKLVDKFCVFDGVECVFSVLVFYEVVFMLFQDVDIVFVCLVEKDIFGGFSFVKDYSMKNVILVNSIEVYIEGDFDLFVQVLKEVLV